MVAQVLLLTEEQGHGGVSTVVGLLEQALQAQGWQVQRVNVRHDRPGFLQLLALAKASQAIVSSNPFMPAYWATLLGLLSRKSSVVWVHGPLAEVLQQRPVSWLKRQWMHTVLRRADLLVMASRTSQHSLHQVFAPETLPPQAIITNPAPPPASEATQRPSPGVALGFVGRLSTEKRPQLLLQMLQHLPEDHHLTLVGDGPMRDELQSQAQALGLLGSAHTPARVRFAGAQPVSVRSYQDWQATLLCSAYEGFPMSALESLAAGVPCVGTPLPALQEMLGTPAPPWLAGDDSPQALALQVRQVLARPPELRRAQALAVAQQHPLGAFGQRWHEQLLRLTRQARPGAKTVHFVHSGPAYMPELAAYARHLAALGHHSVRHGDPATVPDDADIVWWICGHISPRHSHRLRHSLQVHEYASASVGRWPGIKDRIKRWLHPRPDHRVFLNAWVRDRMGFDDDVPFSLREMGVPETFLHAQAVAAPEHDLVYLGEMARLSAFMPTLRAISEAGLRLLLVGQPSPQLQQKLQTLPGVQITGHVPQHEVPSLLLRARAGLNLMPLRRPLTHQTATKVLEYLAVGLPVLSNDYPWARQIAQQHPQRVRLLQGLDQPLTWRQACAQLPPLMPDRQHLQAWCWPQLLRALPLWKSLGLSGGPA